MDIEKNHQSPQKLWGGRFDESTHIWVDTYTSSISEDSFLWPHDILASIAHARMLGACKILPAADAQSIETGLKSIYLDLTSERLTDADAQGAEDIHSQIEQWLSTRIGAVAGKLHTARSRNDQIATDIRLWLREHLGEQLRELALLQDVLIRLAQQHTETILSGLTHLQPAQPVSLGHHLMSYFWMLSRDMQRLLDLWPRVNQLPLGAAALAGTSFPIDREHVAKTLGFQGLCENSLDAVSDRDFAVELLSSTSLTAIHLSRFCEELIIWSHPSFAYISLSDRVTTGSSIMPQKKNPDVAELMRGRTGRPVGALMGLLTMLKGLPLSYNRDLQEDKYHMKTAADSTLQSIRLMRLMLETAKFHPAKMMASLEGDFSNATDLADDLASKGIPFREAHEIVGRTVKWCLNSGRALESVNLGELQSIDPRFDEKSLLRLPHVAVAGARTSRGGTAPVAVVKQIEKAKVLLHHLVDQMETHLAAAKIRIDF